MVDLSPISYKCLSTPHITFLIDSGFLFVDFCYSIGHKIASFPGYFVFVFVLVLVAAVAYVVAVVVVAVITAVAVFVDANRAAAVVVGGGDVVAAANAE